MTTLALGYAEAVGDFTTGAALLTASTDDPYTLEGDADLGIAPLTVRLNFPVFPAGGQDQTYAFWIPAGVGVPTVIDFFILGYSSLPELIDYDGPTDYEFNGEQGVLRVWPDPLPEAIYLNAFFEVTAAAEYPIEAVAVGPFDGRLSRADVLTSLRMPADSESEAVLKVHYAAAVEMIINYAPLAPLALRNEALVRLTGFLFDEPTGNVWGRSGAAGLLAPWVQHSAPVIESPGEEA